MAISGYCRRVAANQEKTNIVTSLGRNLSLPSINRDLHRSGELFADFGVSLIGQISQRNSHGPVGASKTASVEENGGEFLCKSEQDIKGVVIFLEELDKPGSVHLFGPDHDVEGGVIIRAHGIQRKRQLHASPQGLQATFHDLLCEFFVAVVLVQQSKQREQGHLDLLGQRQAGSVIESDATAICDHAI